MPLAPTKSLKDLFAELLDKKEGSKDFAIAYYDDSKSWVAMGGSACPHVAICESPEYTAEGYTAEEALENLIGKLG